jgi:hypothetical protein
MDATSNPRLLQYQQKNDEKGRKPSSRLYIMKNGPKNGRRRSWKGISVRGLICRKPSGRRKRWGNFRKTR